ncbi:C1 family peptidase [Mycoplasma phocoenae]|uniref:Aminopeptidase n=2 Tax=Mycoplasma phocoenae TaxID=754517 RepID=A0A858U7R8_9MOLU|nr:C1 family peptidase [Mycoplasma phocoenae]
MKIDNELINKFEDRFANDKVANIIKNSVAKNGIEATAFNNEVLRKHNFEFSHEVKNGSITNQKSSGRCWIFASLNMARTKSMELMSIKDFEFSENYFLFWEKMEKANTFLENIIQYGLDLEEDDRLLTLFYNGPVSDGGYYEWFASLYKKYGAVPKSVMPETYHSSATSTLEKVLNIIVKQAANEMRKLKANNAPMNKILELKEETLYSVFDTCVKTLGMPPKTFDFEYKDKDDKFVKIQNITPNEFFDKFVGDELENKITLVHDPREYKFPYGRVIQAKYFKTAIEGLTNTALNVPINELKLATIKSIKDNKGVWFACDVSQFIDVKTGILDSELFDYSNVLKPLYTLSKSEQINTHMNIPNHAMNFVGVDLDENEQPIKWKVENSWGDEKGRKGFFSMSDKWFEDFNFECVVDKKYVSEEYLKGLDMEPIIIDPWDPMA